MHPKKYVFMLQHTTLKFMFTFQKRKKNRIKSDLIIYEIEKRDEHD